MCLVACLYLRCIQHLTTEQTHAEGDNICDYARVQSVTSQPERYSLLHHHCYSTHYCTTTAEHHCYPLLLSTTAKHHCTTTAKHHCTTAANHCCYPLLLATTAPPLLRITAPTLLLTAAPPLLLTTTSLLLHPSLLHQHC